jgi:single-strand DNA-binding protein
VLIEGRLQLDSWEDKESGQKRSKLKVVCENMRMVGGRGEGGGGGGRGEGTRSEGPRSGGQRDMESAGSGPEEFHESPPDDDVPF